MEGGWKDLLDAGKLSIIVAHMSDEWCCQSLHRLFTHWEIICANQSQPGSTRNNSHRSATHHYERRNSSSANPFLASVLDETVVVGACVRNPPGKKDHI